jgi:hypothetical protein
LFSLFLSFFLILTNRPRGGKDLLEIFLGIKGSSKTFFCLSYSVGIEREGEPDANPSVKPLPLSDLNQAPPSNPVDERHPASTQTSTPSCNGSARALHAASAVTMPIVDAHLGLDSTDHLWTCHLAIELLFTRMIISPGRRHLGPTVHVALTSPSRRCCAAQRAQRALHVPVHLHIAQLRPAPAPARRHAGNTRPPDAW